MTLIAFSMAAAVAGFESATAADELRGDTGAWRKGKGFEFESGSAHD